MTKKRFKASINNKTYILMGDYSNEHFQTTTDLVNQELSQIKRLMGTLDQEQAAILLALNTVSTQLTQEQEILNLRKQIKKLEFELQDARHPERLVQRGMSPKKEEGNFGEQLSIEEFTPNLPNRVGMSTETPYVPAIFNKEGKNND